MSLKEARARLYKPQAGEPLAQWRITWRIPVSENDWHGHDFDGGMEMQFHDERDYQEYLVTLRLAEKAGICSAVEAHQREITIGPWITETGEV